MSLVLLMPTRLKVVSKRSQGLSFTVSGLIDGVNETIVVDGKTITFGATSSGTTTSPIRRLILPPYQAAQKTRLC